jgi:hypothetical protein
MRSIKKENLNRQKSVNEVFHLVQWASQEEKCCWGRSVVDDQSVEVSDPHVMMYGSCM